MFVAALASLMGGGLHVQESDGIRAEQALIHVAGAQLKAIMIALAMTGAEEDLGFQEGWPLEESFTVNDTLAAMSGVVTMLQSSRHVLHQLRTELGWNGSSLAREAEGGAS
jgi:hypothetical protein